MGARSTDLLDHWAARGTIVPQQVEAGQRFRRLYDAASLGGHATLDLQCVPGANFARQAPPDAAVRARDELKRIRSRLGGFDFALVCRVVGLGEPLDAEADKDRRYLARRVRDALKLLSARVEVGA